MNFCATRWVAASPPTASRLRQKPRLQKISQPRRQYMRVGGFCSHTA